MNRTTISTPSQGASSSSSSSSQTKPNPVYQAHGGQDVYVLRVNRYHENPSPTSRVLLRFSKGLFSPEAQAAMRAESIFSSALSINEYGGDVGANQVVDVYKHPTLPGRCTALNMSDIVFTKLLGSTPTAFRNQTEGKLTQNKGSVALHNQPGMQFDKSTVVRQGTVNRFVPAENVIPNPSIGQLSDAVDQLLHEKDVEIEQEKFEVALAEAFTDKPIFPEERIFMGLRTLAYRASQLDEISRPLQKASVDDLYRLLDTFEFHIRSYCAVEGHSIQGLRDLYADLRKAREQIPQAYPGFTKIVAVLDRIEGVIQVVEKAKLTERYPRIIKEFLTKIPSKPLKEILVCSVPRELSQNIAIENLILRSSLLLSQFEEKLRGKYPEAIAHLREVDTALRKKDWVAVNVHLCEVLESDLFKQMSSVGSRDLENSELFTAQKLAAGVVNLADFFKDIVGSSAKYEWVNFAAVKESLAYLNFEKPFQKGQLAPLQGWAKEFAELGEQCKNLFAALQKFETATFEKERFSAWLQDVQKGKVDPRVYQELCKKIDDSCVETDKALAEITLEVQTLQALIVFLAEERGRTSIDRDLLAGQLHNLNEKIRAICHPFLYFVNNFKVLMAKEKTASKTYTLPLFETDLAKLFIPHASIGTLDDDAEIRIEEEEVPAVASSIASSSTLEDDLNRVFKNTKRRKIVESLSAFFKAQGQKVRVENGKGSHVKIYLGGVPIVIPSHKELKVGTAGSIRDDILDKLRNLV